MKKLFLSFLFILVSTLSFAINIYPTEFKKDITLGNYEVFSIANDSNEQKIYKINVTMENQHITNIVFPKVFTLNPKEVKEVKVLLKPTTSLKNGVYDGKFSIQILPAKIEAFNNFNFNIHMDISAYINKNPLI